MANAAQVWLRFDQVYKAVELFTADPRRRAEIRSVLRVCPLRQGWSYAYADFIVHREREFAAFILAAGV